MSKNFSHKRTATNLQRYRRKRGMKHVINVGLAFIGAGAVGGTLGMTSLLVEDRVKTGGSISAYAEPLSGCSVTDGDTIRCSGERIRLLGIDAPELPGHCRSGRTCAPGDPYVSARSLGDALNGPLTIKRVGEDRYGRTLAMVASGHGDLSCWQLAHDQVIYREDWDDGLRVARTCPADVL